METVPPVSNILTSVVLPWWLHKVVSPACLPLASQKHKRWLAMFREAGLRSELHESQKGKFKLHAQIPTSHHLW